MRAVDDADRWRCDLLYAQIRHLDEHVKLMHDQLVMVGLVQPDEAAKAVQKVSSELGEFYAVIGASLGEYDDGTFYDKNDPSTW